MNLKPSNVATLNRLPRFYEATLRLATPPPASPWPEFRARCRALAWKALDVIAVSLCTLAVGAILGLGLAVVWTALVTLATSL